MNGCSMNIGFYFFDKGLSGVDCSRPDLGNPGVGGTQYCFLLLIYYILRFDPKSYRVRVYCSSDCFFPQGVEKVLVEDIFEGLTESKRRGDDFIIIKDNKDNWLDLSINYGIALLFGGIIFILGIMPIGLLRARLLLQMFL